MQEGPGVSELLAEDVALRCLDRAMRAVGAEAALEELSETAMHLDELAQKAGTVDIVGAIASGAIAGSVIDRRAAHVDVAAARLTLRHVAAGHLIA